MATISAALVNDYEVVVRGLEAMLRRYQDRVRIVELDLNRQPAEAVDLVLYDTFGSSREMRSEVGALVANPLVRRVAVYSSQSGAAVVEAAFDSGASGFIWKGLPASHLVDALESIVQGSQTVWTGEDGPLNLKVGDWPGREEGLTQREAEVLALITQGLSNAQIAEHAHLSVNSVKTYIRSCYRRLNVTSRTNAVLWGIEHGFRPDHVRIDGPGRRPDSSGASSTSDK